jgi:hypothetical protein
MNESTNEIMSHDEECCLKTALAFAVLRKRLENEDAAPAPEYVGGLFGSTIPSLPSNNTADHLSKMMNVAISTATPLCMSDCTTDTSTSSSLKTLEGVCKHLGLQLRSTSNVSMEWLKEALLNKENMKAVSLVWHLILQAEPSVGAKLLPAIGQVLQHMYSSTEDASFEMVELLELTEASVCIRLSTTSSLVLLQELSTAIGPELCLPVAPKDLAYFYLCNKRPGNKILLRYCLYDLLEKLSAYNNNV